MRTMEDLRRRIANVNDVQSIVSTMKTLAAVQMRQYESAANAMTDYLRTVELGFHVLQRIDGKSRCITTSEQVLRRRRNGCTAVPELINKTLNTDCQSNDYGGPVKQAANNAGNCWAGRGGRGRGKYGYSETHRRHCPYKHLITGLDLFSKLI